MGKNKNKKKLSILRMKAARKTADSEQSRQGSPEAAAGSMGPPPAVRGRSLVKKRGGGAKGRSKSAPPAPHRRAREFVPMSLDDINYRYWTLVVGDLQKAISELYIGCKTQEDLAHTKEVLAVLDRSRVDFAKLIDGFS